MRISEEPCREHHRPVREQRDQDVAPVQAGHEREIQDHEGRGERPVDIPRPEDLSKDVLVHRGAVVLVRDGEDVVREEGPGAGGLGVVGEGGDGEEEGGDDVEEAYLLAGSYVRYILL
jgi:hypothetical protein